MLRSLRARLLLWYTLIMAVTIAAFTATVCYEFWRSLVDDIDRNLAASAMTLSQALQPVPGGGFDFDVPASMRPNDDSAGPPLLSYAIWGANGELIDRLPADADLERPAAPGATTRNGHREFAALMANGAAVVVARNLDDARRDVIAFAWTAAFTGIAALGVALAGGWFLAGRALAPVARISSAATAMAAGKLDARIPIERTENELEQVASVLNDAFDRLHAAVERQRQFTADASHELRTPLATISAESEWALMRQRDPDAYRRSLETCQRAAARMTRVVHRLLTLARVDAQDLAITRVPVPLVPLVEDALAIVRPLAERKHVTIVTAFEPASVFGDQDRLTDLTANLCSNAVEHNRQNGTVTVTVTPDAEDVVFQVEDTGAGINAADLPHVFDRFFRTDRSRTAASGGAGLGLAIARAVVDAHGGQITCKSTEGVGTTVTVRLPRAAEPAA